MGVIEHVDSEFDLRRTVSLTVLEKIEVFYQKITILTQKFENLIYWRKQEK